jgi:hypothetical protein
MRWTARSAKLRNREEKNKQTTTGAVTPPKRMLMLALFVPLYTTWYYK